MITTTNLLLFESEKKLETGQDLANLQVRVHWHTVSYSEWSMAVFSHPVQANSADAVWINQHSWCSVPLIMVQLYQLSANTRMANQFY